MTHQGVASVHTVQPEPDLWLSLLIAVIGLLLIAWSLHDEWRSKRREAAELPNHAP